MEHTESPQKAIRNPEQTGPYKFDAVVVLGANMVIDEKTGKPYFPTEMVQPTKEGDKLLTVEGRTRAVATEQAYQERLAPKFIVVGGTQKGMEISNADALADLITDKYKVPKDVVKPLNGGANNTLGNTEILTQYLSENPEIKKIGILTNKWHMERAVELLHESEYFKAHDITIYPLIAEDLMLRRSPKYNSYIEAEEKSPAMQNRKKAEAQGLQDLREKTYEKNSSKSA